MDYSPLLAALAIGSGCRPGSTVLFSHVEGRELEGGWRWSVRRPHVEKKKVAKLVVCIAYQLIAEMNALVPVVLRSSPRFLNVCERGEGRLDHHWCEGFRPDLPCAQELSGGGRGSS